MSDDIKKPEDTSGSTGETAEETVASATDDTVAAVEDTVAASEDTVSDVEDTVASAEDTASTAEDAVAASEDTVSDAEDTVVSAEDTASTAEDIVASSSDTDIMDYAEETDVNDPGERIMTSANEQKTEDKRAEIFTEKETVSKQTETQNSYDTEPDVSIPVRKKKRSKAIHLAWIIPAAAAGIFAGVVLGGAGKYNDRFWNNTYLGDIYVGGKTIDEVNELLKNENKELKITTRDGKTETILLDDINYQSSFSTDIRAIKDSQSPYAWFLNNSGEKVYDVDINTSYDENALEEKLSELDCIVSDSIQDPTDAHLALVGDSFTIVEATEGNRIDPEKLNNVISQAVKSGVFEVNLSDTDCYVTPKIYGDDAELNTTLNNINALKGNTVTLNLHDAEETIDSSVFMDWIHTEGTQPVMDDEPILEYLNGIAEKYNTFGTERDFDATGLGKIKVGGGPQDSYGFLLDVESTKDAVKEAIMSGNSDTVDCFWSVPANHRNQSNGDIGNTYVEIDISRQHMWYYIDGKLFTDTDVRTGTESSAQWTPTTEGVYRILWKQRDKWFLQVGEPCHSDYWMPFNSRGEGIHDATWYSTYGGNLYKWAGSHGCINTPYNIAQLIYENIEAGTPVIVYRS